MQHALDMLKDTYTSHYVRSSRGHGGRPNQLWHQYPHPGGNPTLPQGYDAVAEYESANPGKTVTRRPAWVAERDPISKDQAKRLTRHQAILNIWGPDATRVARQADIQHNSGRALRLFRPFSSSFATRKEHGPSTFRGHQ